MEGRPGIYHRRWDRYAIAQFRLKQNKWNAYAKGTNNHWIEVLSIAPYSDFEYQVDTNHYASFTSNAYGMMDINAIALRASPAKV